MDDSQADIVGVAAHYFMLVLKPLIIAVGFFGNIATISIIRSTASLRSLASNNYLIALAFCDLAFLTTVFVIWLEYLGVVGLYNASVIGCKTFTYVSQASDAASVWLIVAVSFDRFLVVYVPRLKLLLLRNNVQRRLTVSILVIAAIASLWSFLEATVKKKWMPTENGLNFTVVEVCDFGGSEKLYATLNTLDSLLVGFLPAIFIIVVNGAIACRLVQMRRLSPPHIRLQRASDDDKQGHHIDDNGPLTLSTATRGNASSEPGAAVSIPLLAINDKLAPAEMLTDQLSSASPERKLTHALIAVTTVYVLLNVPSYVCRLVASFKEQNDAAETWLVYHVFEVLSYGMYYLHHAVNFYLYAIFSPEMRRAFVVFVGNCRLRRYFCTEQHHSAPI